MSGQQELMALVEQLRNHQASRRRLLGVLAEVIEAERNVMEDLTLRFAVARRRDRSAGRKKSWRREIVSLLQTGPMSAEEIGAKLGHPDRLPGALRQGLYLLKKSKAVKVNKAGDYVLRVAREVA